MYKAQIRLLCVGYTLSNMYSTDKTRLTIFVLTNTARTLKAQSAFEGLTPSELAENMILHCLTNEGLLKRLIAECQAAKAQAKQAA
jgi:hypothetical protein